MKLVFCVFLAALLVYRPIFQLRNSNVQLYPINLCERNSILWHIPFGKPIGPKSLFSFGQFLYFSFFPKILRRFLKFYIHRQLFFGFWPYRQMHRDAKDHYGFWNLGNSQKQTNTDGSHAQNPWNAFLRICDDNIRFRRKSSFGILSKFWTFRHLRPNMPNFRLLEIFDLFHKFQLKFQNFQILDFWIWSNPYTISIILDLLG